MNQHVFSVYDRSAADMKQQLKVVKKPEILADSTSPASDNIMHSADLDTFITNKASDNDQK